MIWVEKYRPKSIEDMALPNEVKATFRSFISQGMIPHLLFYGSPGTGKTTVARILINSLNCIHMELNASDERGIDTVRDKVKSFASVKTIKNFKIVFLDEADALTPQAQQTLRNMMEKFHKTTRFIFTANYKNKIIDAIQSRCQSFEFVKIDKNQSLTILKRILSNENISYNESDLLSLIGMYNGDLRKIINEAQKLSSSGKLVLKNDNEYKEVLKLIKSKDIGALKEFFSKNNVNWLSLYRYLYNNEVNPKNLFLIAKYLYQDSICADSEINFMGLVSEYE